MRRAMITAMMAGVLTAGSAACAQNARQAEPVPGKDGNKYVPYEERTGNESIVYFTRDLSPEGLRKAYEAVCGDIVGRVAVKLHTGEQNGPNIIPSSWVKELIEKDIPDATIVETNTYYVGDRYIIIDLDNGGRRITVGEAVKDLKPFVAAQK